MPEVSKQDSNGVAEVDFRNDSGLPQMPNPQAPDNGRAADWQRKVLDFHQHGRSLEPQEGLSPAALVALSALPNGEHPFVVYYGTGGATSLGLFDVWTNAIEQVRPDPMVKGNLHRLVELASSILEQGQNGLLVADLLD